MFVAFVGKPSARVTHESNEQSSPLNNNNSTVIKCVKSYMHVDINKKSETPRCSRLIKHEIVIIVNG